MEEEKKIFERKWWRYTSFEPVSAKRYIELITLAESVVRNRVIDFCNDPSLFMFELENCRKVAISMAVCQVGIAIKPSNKKNEKWEKELVEAVAEAMFDELVFIMNAAKSSS